MTLHLQLECFETGLFPRAILRDDDGVFIKNVDLGEAGDGLYTAKDTMPSQNVYATYQVFSDAARTTLTKDGAGVDLFILATDTTVRRDDKIVGVIGSSGVLIGRIEEEEIVGVMKQSDALVGVMESSELQGKIDSSVIVGVLHC